MWKLFLFYIIQDYPSIPKSINYISSNYKWNVKKLRETLVRESYFCSTIIQWPPCTKRPNYLLIYWRASVEGIPAAVKHFERCGGKIPIFTKLFPIANQLTGDHPSGGRSIFQAILHFREPDDRPMRGGGLRSTFNRNVQPPPSRCSNWLTWLSNAVATADKVISSVSFVVNNRARRMIIWIQR